LFEKYNNSPIKLLSIMFPEYEWLPWKFTKCPNSFWADLKNQKKFMDWAFKELKFSEITDWYNLNTKVVQ
jgi:hypothetical protein